MENSRDTLFSMPVQFVLVLGGVIALIAFVSAYGTNNPTIFGHSSDEIEYPFTIVVQDCSGSIGPCVAQCSAGEYLVSGSCSTSEGWLMMTRGGVDRDADGHNDAWECTELSSTPIAVYISRAVCLAEN